MGQLAIALPHVASCGREDFMVSTSNATAVALLDTWPDWPHGALALTGPDGSGKSHLARIWADEAGATIVAASDLRAEDAPGLAEGPVAVEDVDRGAGRAASAQSAAGDAAREEALFHLWNACAQGGRGLLLTGRAVPSEWPVTLPDLRSRLSAVTPAVLADPDDALLSVVLLKLFADRQLVVKPALIGFLLPRMERSHAAARDIVARIDAESLARGVAPNQTLARDLLDG